MHSVLRGRCTARANKGSSDVIGAAKMAINSYRTAEMSVTVGETVADNDSHDFSPLVGALLPTRFGAAGGR